MKDNGEKLSLSRKMRSLLEDRPQKVILLDFEYNVMALSDAGHRAIYEIAVMDGTGQLGCRAHCHRPPDDARRTRESYLAQTSDAWLPGLADCERFGHNKKQPRKILPRRDHGQDPWENLGGDCRHP